MEEQTKTFVDSRTAQELRTNPVEQIRRPTDRLFIFIFPLFIIAWLVIGVLALRAQQPNSESADQRAQMMAFVNAPFSRFRFMHIVVFAIALVLSIAFILLGIFLNKKFTKFFVYLGIGLYILYTASFCFKLLFGDVTYDHEKFRIHPSLDKFLIYLNSVSRGWLLLKAIFMIVSVISFFQTDKDEIRNVVKDFCRIILASPFLILFVGLITILGCFIFSFTANAIVSDLTSDRNAYHVLVDMFVLILGCAFALSFISNFALMVISEYTVNYYWRKGGKPAVGDSVSQILKNHTGTIMFSCIPLLPFICAIVQAVKHTRSPRNKENIIFYFASKIFLVLNIEYFALIVSSIYATGFVKSLRKTLDTVLRRCLFYLATSGVIEAIIGIIAAIVIILAAIAFTITTVIALTKEQKDLEKAGIQDSSRIDTDTVMVMASFLYGFFIPFVTFALLMYFSAKALLINKIIILNREEQYNEGKTEILNRL